MTEIKNTLPDPDLQRLIEEQYRESSKGCVWGLIGLATGSHKKRAKEIAPRLGIKPDEVIQTFGAINLIGMGSRTKKESEEKLLQAIMKGTNGGQSTRRPSVDRKIVNVVVFAKMANDEYWRVREERFRQKASK